MNRPTVYQVLDTTSAGGTWRHVLDLSARMTARGVETVLLLPDAGLQRASAEERGIPVTTSRRLPRRVVLHVHLAYTLSLTFFFLMVRARLSGSRVVLTEHLPRTDATDHRVAMRRPRFGASALKFLRKRLQLLPVHEVIVLDETGCRFIKRRWKLGDRRIRIVSNGVDPLIGPGDASETERSVPRFVASGSLIHQKGFDVLVESIAHGREAWVVDVFGVGPHGSRWRQRSAELSKVYPLREVVFRGWTDDMSHELRACDGFVLPSRWEAFGYVLLDALNHGLAVVCSAVDGPSVIVTDGVTGLHVPPDDPQALASALDRLAVDPALRRELGRRGRAHVMHSYRLENMVDNVLQAYWGSA